MYEWLDRVIKVGETRGEVRVENYMCKLMLMLFNLGRKEDANRAAADLDYRKKIYQKFQIV